MKPVWVLTGDMYSSEEECLNGCPPNHKAERLISYDHYLEMKSFAEQMEAELLVITMPNETPAVQRYRAWLKGLK